MVRVTSATTTLRSRGSAVAREDNDRAASFQLQLEPSDLAGGYQGPSRIASRAFVSAQASSVAAVFSRAAHCSSSSRSRTSRASTASASASVRSSTMR
jgi:hypothetical protein